MSFSMFRELLVGANGLKQNGYLDGCWFMIAKLYRLILNNHQVSVSGCFSYQVPAASISPTAPKVN